MTGTSIVDRASELAGARTPFVRATVVRAQAPTSVQPGDHALVLSDGTIEGFVGGQCTQNSVRTAALAALAGSAATLLRVLPDDKDPFPATPGAEVVVNPCQSGGAVEIFLEPMLPPPLLTITGSTPIARALRVLAADLGYAVAGSTLAEDHHDVRAARDLAGSVAVILASHGPGEAETLRAALDARVPYIGLVASRRRSTAVFDEMGLNEEERTRIDAPAGQWIGARTAPEIALSILAQVVAIVRLEQPAPASPVAEPAAGPSGDWQAAPPATSAAAPSRATLTPVQAIDPVCQMTVTIQPDTPHAVVDGVDYYFCRPGCRETFLVQHQSDVTAGTAVE